MIRSAFSQSAPIGLDIGRRYIRAAQMSGSRLVAAMSMPRTGAGDVPDASEIGRLIQALRRKGPQSFHGRTVVLAVPPDNLMTSILELPPRSSGAPLEQLARVELGRRHEVDMAGVEMACWDLPTPARAANRTCVMAVACKQQDADALLEGLESQGLSVRAMDVHALALGRACGNLLAGQGHTGAILDVGWSSARLVLLYQGVAVYERNLAKCGTRCLGEQPAGQAEVLPGPSAPADAPVAVKAQGQDLSEQVDALAAEVHIPLSYLASQYPDALAKQLVLVGGGANIPLLAERLSEKLDLAVRCPALSEFCPCDDSLGGMGPSMALAVGLAQYVEDGQ